MPDRVDAEASFDTLAQAPTQVAVARAILLSAGRC